MKKIFYQIPAIMVLVVISGCTSILELFPSSIEIPISGQNTNTDTGESSPETILPTDTPTIIPPTQTPIPTFTPTPTPQEIINNPTPDLVATIAALQATLEAATIHITTLEAKKSSPPTSSSSSSSSPSSSSPTSSSPNLPSNVRQVTVIHRANLRISKRNNAAGKPIMSIPKTRIILNEGAQQYIYKKRVDADGEMVYYEIYDPDGIVTQVLYIRAVDIQFRTSQYNTQWGTIPEGVVIAKVPVPKATLRYIKGYNTHGKPIMRIIEPRAILLNGDQTWVYPAPVISDGGDLFYETYDPDGQVAEVLYARIGDLHILNALDQ